MGLSVFWSCWSSKKETHPYVIFSQAVKTKKQKTYWRGTLLVFQTSVCGRLEIGGTGPLLGHILWATSNKYAPILFHMQSALNTPIEGDARKS